MFKRNVVPETSNRRSVGFATVNYQVVANTDEPDTDCINDSDETNHLIQRTYDQPYGFPVRFTQVFMGCTAITVAYILRVNISVAIVAMTSPSPDTKKPQFDWNEKDKSLILSSFFWGYFMLQIFLGNIAEKYGSKMTLAISVGTCSLLTIVTPFLAKAGVAVMCAFRVLQGAAQGALYPCVTVLMAKWIPPVERGLALTVALSGSNIGLLIGFPLSGWLAASSFDGWRNIFLVSGGIGVVWVLLWLFLGASTPSEHRRISVEEVEYIRTSMIGASTDQMRLKTPWKRIVLSMPLWAIYISHLGQNWGYWTLVTEMPNYINSVLGVNIKSNGILSALPYVCGWMTAILFSWIAKYGYKYVPLSMGVQRKLWNSLALWGGAVVLFVLGVSSTKDVTLVIVMLIMTNGLNSGIYNGFLTNHVEISPNFCGTLMGITNSLANITSILGPLAVGWIVTDVTSIAQWKYVFILAGGIMFVANLFYVVFGSSEVQSWNDGEPVDKERTKNDEQSSSTREGRV